MIEYTFVSGVEVWGEGASWHFVRMPKTVYAEIKELSTSSGPRRGFGAVKVEATIGQTTWRTSVFPDTEDKSYILFVKKSVRSAENIAIESVLTTSLKLLL